MSNVRQIAQEAGVSITTVSRVLNNHPQVKEDTREKVLAAANRARYVPSVGKRSTTTIGMVYTGELSMGSPFDSALMEGMTEAMKEFAFDLLLLDVGGAREAGEGFSQMFISKGVRGVVLRSTAASRGTVRSIAEEKFPAVVLGDRFDHPTLRFVGSDSGLASRQAVDHLLELGHRDIGVVTNIEEDADHTDRLDAYRAALEAAGVAYDESRIFRTPANREGGVAFMNRFAAMNRRPTALFILDPPTAVTAISRAAALGIRIPDDLSVVGFDDHDWRHMTYPNYTSVCQDVVALGRSAFQVLHDVIRNAAVDAGRPRARAAWLEVHETTAPPRSARGE